MTPTKPSRPSCVVWPDGRRGRINWSPGPMKGSGETDQPHGDIRIRQGLDDHEAALVLLHELLHNVFWTLDSEDEEHIVTVAECGIGALWRSNREVFAWLHGQLSQ